MGKLRIAHISDLHFAKVCFSPFQFFSKRWIGNGNLLLRRRNYLVQNHLDILIQHFEEHKIDTVFITGDFSTTSRPVEFEKAVDFVNKLKKAGLQVIAIPGNHDHYTKNAWRKKRYYNYLPDHTGGGFSLKKDGLAALELSKEWTVIPLDTALATPLLSSRGAFQPEQEKKLEALLSSIPENKHVLLLNHFPLFEHERETKVLEGAPALRNLLKKFPHVRFYLHGHTHNHCIADLRSFELPIVLDSGSTSNHSSSSWNIIELFPQGATVQALRSPSKTLNTWQVFQKHSWNFSS